MNSIINEHMIVKSHKKIVKIPSIAVYRTRIRIKKTKTNKNLQVEIEDCIELTDHTEAYNSGTKENHLKPQAHLSGTDGLFGSQCQVLLETL